MTREVGAADVAPGRSSRWPRQLAAALLLDRSRPEEMVMSLLKWRDVIKRDFPEMGPITSETKRRILLDRRRFRGGVRISTGRIWESAEYEQRRKRVLDTPLP